MEAQKEHEHLLEALAEAARSGDVAEIKADGNGNGGVGVMMG